MLNTGWSWGRTRLDSGHQSHVVGTALGLTIAHPALCVIHEMGWGKPVGFSGSCSKSSILLCDPRVQAKGLVLAEK